MTPFKLWLAALLVVFVFGCAGVKSRTPAKVVFVKIGREIEVPRGEEVRIGWSEVLSRPGPDAPPTARFEASATETTAQWVGDTIVVKITSNRGRDIRVETKTIELSQLPLKVNYGPAGNGEFRVNYAPPSDEPNRSQR